MDRRGKTICYLWLIDKFYILFSNFLFLSFNCKKQVKFCRHKNITEYCTTFVIEVFILTQSNFGNKCDIPNCANYIKDEPILRFWKEFAINNKTVCFIRLFSMTIQMHNSSTIIFLKHWELRILSKKILPNLTIHDKRIANFI